MENIPQNPEQNWPGVPKPHQDSTLIKGSNKKWRSLLLIIAALIGSYFALAKYQSWWPFEDKLSVKNTNNNLKTEEFFSQKCNFLDNTKKNLFSKKQNAYFSKNGRVASHTYELSFKYPDCFMTKNDPMQLDQVQWFFVRNDSANFDDGKTNIPNMWFDNGSNVYSDSYKIIKSQGITVGVLKAVKRLFVLDVQKCEEEIKKTYPDLSKQIKDFVKKSCQSKYKIITLDVFWGDPKFYDNSNLSKDTIFGLTLTYDLNDPFDFELFMDRIISTLSVNQIQ